MIEKLSIVFYASGDVSFSFSFLSSNGGAKFKNSELAAPLKVAISY